MHSCMRRKHSWSAPLCRRRPRVRALRTMRQQPHDAGNNHASLAASSLDRTGGELWGTSRYIPLADLAGPLAAQTIYRLRNEDALERDVRFRYSHESLGRLTIQRLATERRS